MEHTDELVAKLKGKGFILNSNKETFSLRIVTGNGVVSSEKMVIISEAAKKYASGKVGITTRMGFEIMGIKPENVEAIEEYLTANGIEIGGTGAKIRPIVACKGTVCRFGLHDTQAFAWRLHEEFYRGWHDVALPAKFKICVGGCPNNCAKPALNDFSVMGAAKGEKCLKIFIGGKYGRKSRQGSELDGLFTQDEAVAVLTKVLNYYKANANPKERLGDMIDRIGFEEVQKAILG